MAGAMRGAFEHSAKFVVGCVQDTGERVEARRCEEGTALDALRDSVGKVWREPTREPVEAAGGVLVDVGVPGSGKWDASFPGEVSSEDAELAGASDVDDVWLKTSKFAANSIGVAPE